jgi:hypothetical protein
MTEPKIEDILIKEYGFYYDKDNICTRLIQSGVDIKYCFDFRFSSKCLLNGRYYPVYLQKPCKTIREALLIFNILSGDTLRVESSEAKLKSAEQMKVIEC